nr:FtsX-like permease family protein [Flavisolibacter sp.]
LQEKVDILTADVLKKEMQGPPGSSMKYHLEPLKSVHLHSKLDGFEPNNSIIYIYILATVALMILLIAFVNYTNLSTAQSARRSTEIGMRKVMGAGKKQVFFQFISEFYLITLFAILVALLLSVIMLPSFNQLSGKNLNTGLLFSPFIIVMLLVLSIIIAFSAGVYPAVILSGSKVIHVLKAGFRFTGSGALRKSLIVFQFAISLFLMIATIIILQQLEFIRNKDLGFNKNQVMVLPLDAKMTENYDGLKKALLNLPGVQSVGGAYESPVDIGWGDGLRKTTGESITVNALPVDEDFSKTLDLKIIAGNHYSWSDVLQFDTSNDGNNIRYSFILNEAAVKALGWKPEEAIGKTLTKGKDGIVKAVVKDFHFRSFHETINPLVIFLDKRLMGSLFIRIQGDTRTALDAVGATWKQRVPHRPFEYSFLDEEFDALYKTEQRTANVFTAFSSLAIFLACLGLFALTAYAMVQRTKEIGIRKVLGARVTDILSLVSKDFLKLIVISMLIAIPLALFAMNKWLEDFIYKTPIQWWVFLAAGILTWLIAFLTISIQALKTALANPVKNLRTE